MNKLNKIFILSVGILVANNGYSNPSDWEIIDISAKEDSNGFEVISIDTKNNLQTGIIKDASEIKDLKQSVIMLDDSEQPKIVKDASEIKDLKQSVVMLDDSEQPKIVKDASEIKDLKQSVIMLDDSEEDKSRQKVEKYIKRKQLKNTMFYLYKNIVKPLSNNLQQTLDNLINQSNDFITDVSKYKNSEREIHYINILSKLKEANEQFIDDLNEFKYDINEYNESIKRKLNNIYKNNKSNLKIGKLIEGVVLEIANKFEEYAATFDYLLNNKKNINNLRKQSMNKFTSELVDKFGDYASNLLNNIQTDLSSKDESYGDKLNSILQYASKPYFIANGNIQYVIKEGNKFIDRMVETNNKIQEQFVKKDLVNKLQTVAIS